jgi:hypothetical protein
MDGLDVFGFNGGEDESDVLSSWRRMGWYIFFRGNGSQVLVHHAPAKFHILTPRRNRRLLEHFDHNPIIAVLSLLGIPVRRVVEELCGSITMQTREILFR